MSTMEKTEQPTNGDVPIRSDAERKQLLARTIQTQVVQGARVESQNDFSAVLLTGRRSTTPCTRSSAC
jgi:hypothetical protein